MDYPHNNLQHEHHNYLGKQGVLIWQNQQGKIYLPKWGICIIGTRAILLGKRSRKQSICHSWSLVGMLRKITVGLCEGKLPKFGWPLTFSPWTSPLSCSSPSNFKVNFKAFYCISSYLELQTIWQGPFCFIHIILHSTNICFEGLLYAVYIPRDTEIITLRALTNKSNVGERPG